MFLDSSTLFLGLFLTLSAAAAFASGFLWGGRTWCHALCPIAPVERIYSGACGLLERRIEDGSPRFAAARCSGQAPDLKPCVGCAKDCQDISPSAAHAAALRDPAAAFSHYAFFGLILAFYAFFALHSGDPDHYFSGDWSHGADPLADLSSPGFWWNGAAILPWVPKTAAAFLLVLTFSAASWALGAASEAVVLRLAKAKDEDAAALWRHRVFAVWAFLSFALFYAFAGRSNIALLPEWGRAAVDGLLAATALGWLAKSLRWTPPGRPRGTGKSGAPESKGRNPAP